MHKQPTHYLVFCRDIIEIGAQAAYSLGNSLVFCREIIEIGAPEAYSHAAYSLRSRVFCREIIEIGAQAAYSLTLLYSVGR